MIRAIIMEWVIGWNSILKKKKRLCIYDVYHKLQNIAIKL